MARAIKVFCFSLITILLIVNTYLFLYKNEQYKFVGSQYLFSIVDDVPADSLDFLTDFINNLYDNSNILEITESIGSLTDEDWGLFNFFKPVFSFFVDGFKVIFGMSQQLFLLLSMIIYYFIYLCTYIYYFFTSLFIV